MNVMRVRNCTKTVMCFFFFFSLFRLCVFLISDRYLCCTIFPYLLLGDHVPMDMFWRVDFLLILSFDYSALVKVAGRSFSPILT